MKIELFASILLLLACLTQAAFIGNFELKSTDLRLNSAVKASITFEEAQISAARLSISGNVETSLDKILSEDSNGVILINTPSLSGISSAFSLQYSSGCFTGAFTSAIMSWGYLPRHASLGMLMMGLLPMIRSDSPFEVQIVVQYPTGYRFNSIDLNLVDGSVASSQQLNVGGLDINIGQSGTVDIKNVVIGSNININVPVSVTLAQIAISQDATLDVQSNGDIFMSFLQGFEFYGSYSVKGNGADLPSNCSGTSQNNMWTGTCFNSNSGTLNVQSTSGTVTIRFLTADQVEGYCTNFATSDFVPPMPEVTPITTLPSQSWNLMNISTWRGTARGYYSMQSSQTNGVMSATKNSWNNPLMLLQDDGQFLPNGLNPNRRYKMTFSLKFSLDFTPTFNLTARVMAYDELNTFNDNEVRGIGWSEDPKDGIVGRALVESDPLPLGTWTSTEWKTFSYEFTPSAMAQRAYAAVWISDFPDSTVSIKDVTFEVLETPYSVPTFYDAFYRAAYIPSMPMELDPNPRQNCPHLQDGLKRWEDPSTWPNGIPSAGSSVTLPANTKVLVGPCSFTSKTPFNEITVPETSELIFADAPIDLHVRTIWVNGALRMGSETCRLFSKISITFYGTRQDTPTMGKGIVASETSTLDIHGKQYNPTWTRLAAPVLPGDSRIYLQHPVNWEAGQKIMLTTAGIYDLYYDMNEVLTIKSVNQKIIDLVSPAQRYHHASPEYQNEVALLSRRILLQGAEDSVAGAFGGHVMIMGEGRVRGVETFRMGQNNTLARYPLHFHMMGVAPESYFKDNSVHDSYFRCYTVHGTSNVIVARNVAFRTTGHCFYLEDGVEENNTIEYNLAAHVNIIAPIATAFAQFMDDMPETPERHLPADSAASGFYISNAWNIVRGNAASGGWAGFAYPLFQEPMGLSKGTAFVVPPKNKPSLVFDGNTAHSSGAYWAIFAGCVYSGGSLFYDDNGVLTYNGGRSMGDGAKTSQIWLGDKNFQIVNFTITNLKVWSCGQGVNHWGNNVLFQNNEIHDSGRGMTMFGPAYIYDSVLTARTSNPMGYVNRGQQGWQFYDVWSSALLNNVTFINFRRDSPPITDPNYATNCLTVLNNGPNPPYSRNTGISGTANLHFENTDVEVRVQMTNETNRRTSNIIDFDGSLTGISSGAVIGSDQPFWKVGSDCTYRNDWVAWVCPLTPTRTQISVGVKTGSTGLSGSVSLFGVDSQLGTRTVQFNSDEYGATGLNSEGWYFNFGSTTPTSLTFLPEKIPPGHKVIVGVSYPAGTTFGIQYGVGWMDPNGVYTKVNSINEVKSNLFSYYFDGSTLFFSLHNYFINPYYHHEDLSGRGDTIYGTNGGESVVTITASCSTCNVNFKLPASLN